jgi:hypothetical protein
MATNTVSRRSGGGRGTLFLTLILFLLSPAVYAQMSDVATKQVQNVVIRAHLGISGSNVAEDKISGTPAFGTST